MRPLGETQREVLRAMKCHGYWSTHFCGWVWSSKSKTQKICESLVSRGLATKKDDPKRGTVYEAIEQGGTNAD